MMAAALQPVMAAARPDLEPDLICEACGRKKTRTVSFLGRTVVVACECDCDREKELERRKAQERTEAALRINRMRSVGFPDVEMARLTFAQDDGKTPQMTRIAKNYAANFRQALADGKGLVFYGSVGSGKTFAAAAIVNELIDQGFPCLMTNVSRLVNMASVAEEGRQAFYDRLNEYSLLVIDDFLSEWNTEYMVEQTLQIIDARYRARLPLIITTNLSGEQLKGGTNAIDRERIYSRLAEMCVLVNSDGYDRRREISKQTIQKYGRILTS